MEKTIESPETLNPATNQPALLPVEQLHDFVRAWFARKDEFLSIAAECEAPLYVLETEVLRRRARQFREAFESRLPWTSFYYAMKSNNQPDVAATLLECGYGLDVSSGIELQTALGLDGQDIIFSGPGKTDAELRLAVAHADRVVVLMDSFGELERLAAVADDCQTPVRAGIRISANHHGLWRKFGIPLEDLRRFIERCDCHSFIDLQGIQLHTSWNLDPERQRLAIEALGRELQQWPEALRAGIRFVDIGGGYWPPQGEWMQYAATPEGQREADEEKRIRPLDHYWMPSTPIVDFAEEIAQTLQAHLLPFVSGRICFEPGRWICNDAMHFLMRVIDRKSPDLVITDAGTNMIGWERLEVDYAPVLNLSRPALRERPCHVLGALCTPHDVWGYAYWGKDIRPGDVLLIPWQGAYTFSLRQQFIKAVPDVAVIAGDGAILIRSESPTLDFKGDLCPT